MSRMKVEDNLPKFATSAYRVLDDALKEGARDILIDSKNKAPFRKGQLRSDTDITRPGNLHYRISYHKEYARYQEFGGDGRRTIRNYTTAGTGKGFLKNAGDKKVQQLNGIFRKHGGRARA